MVAAGARIFASWRPSVALSFQALYRGTLLSYLARCRDFLQNQLSKTRADRQPLFRCAAVSRRAIETEASWGGPTTRGGSARATSWRALTSLRQGAERRAPAEAPPARRLLSVASALGCLATGVSHSPAVWAQAETEAASPQSGASPRLRRSVLLLHVDGECPSAALVQQELGPLLKRHVVALVDDNSASSATVHVMDQGASYSVGTGDLKKSFDEPARNCQERAHVAAVFVAIDAEPHAPTEPAAKATPRPSDPPPPPKRSGPAPVQAPKRALELVALAGAALDVDAVWIGPMLRAAYGRTWSLGVAAGLQWSRTQEVLMPQAMLSYDLRRLPTEAFVRYRAALQPVELGVEFSVRPTWLRAESSLPGSTEQHRLELAMGPALSLSLADSELAPLFLVRGSWVPSPFQFRVEPLGPVAESASWWLEVGLGGKWRF